MDLGIFYVPPTPQSGKAAEKTPTKPCDVEVYEKKIKLLEKQRKDVSLACLLSYLLLILFCHRGKSLCILFPTCSVVFVSLSGFLQVLEVNKQWDIQWNAMKSQFEQKVQ